MRGPVRGGPLVPSRRRMQTFAQAIPSARLDAIAFTHGYLADPPGALGGDGRVIAFDPSAHRDHAWRNGGRRQGEAPDRKPAEAPDNPPPDHPPRAPGPALSARTPRRPLAAR